MRFLRYSSDFQARIEGIMRQLRVSSIYYSNRFMRSRCGVTNHAARQIRRPSHLLREPLARFWMSAYIQFLRQILSMTANLRATVKLSLWRRRRRRMLRCRDERHDGWIPKSWMGGDFFWYVTIAPNLINWVGWLNIPLWTKARMKESWGAFLKLMKCYLDLRGGLGGA